MNLYLLTCDLNLKSRGDYWEGVVVAAESAVKARKIHPAGRWTASQSWAKHPKFVQARLLGKAKASVETGVVLASWVSGA